MVKKKYSKEQLNKVFELAKTKIDLTNMSAIKLKKMFPFFEDIGLNPRQIKFVVAYVETDFKSRIAYKLAGYESKTDNAMDVTCSHLLRAPKIKQGLREYIKARLEDNKDTLDKKLIDTLMSRAFYDSTVFMNKDGTFKDLTDIPDKWKCCIDGVEKKYYGKDANVEVTILKLANKDKALDHLIKYANLISETSSVTVNLGEDTQKKLKKIFEDKKEK